jgi:hypothetical protein
MKPVTKGMLLLGGFAVPLSLAAIFVFGCCVLPFHKYLHRAMPLCHLASEVLASHHDGDRGGDHTVTPPSSRERAPFASPSAGKVVSARVFMTITNVDKRVDMARSDHRNFIALGAARCETDVGLELLLTTFRI